MWLKLGDHEYINIAEKMDIFFSESILGANHFLPRHQNAYLC